MKELRPKGLGESFEEMVLKADGEYEERYLGNGEIRPGSGIEESTQGAGEVFVHRHENLSMGIG